MGTLEYVELHGWRRDWSVVLENAGAAGRFELEDSGEVPERVVALNLVRHLGPSDLNAWPGGVLAGVSEAEIGALDAREAHYDRVDITDDVVGRHDYERIWTYMAKPEYVRLAPEAVVSASYVRLVEAGFAALGADMVAAFWRSTAAVPGEPVETVFREGQRIVVDAMRAQL